MTDTTPPPIERLHSIIRGAGSEDPTVVMAAIVASGDVEAALALVGADVIAARLRAVIRRLGRPENGGEADVHVREHDRRKPGHAPKRSDEAKARLAASAGKSLFNSIIIHGRRIGDFSYSELEASIRICRAEGIENLRLAFLQKRLIESVPYNPALQDVPVREWGDESILRAAVERWGQMETAFPKWTVKQIEQVLHFSATNP